MTDQRLAILPARPEIGPEVLERLKRLSVVHAYDIRMTIVTELFLREMSPTLFFKQFGGGSVARVERHFKRLEEYGWLRHVREESGGKRRGGCEHFYRATELAIFDGETWPLLPYSVRATHGWKTFKRLAEVTREAFDTGTFDARLDRHVSSRHFFVDELGWDRSIARLEAGFSALLEEQADARLRIFQSGEKPFLVTVLITAFESPFGARATGIAPRLAEGVESLIPTYGRFSKVLADELSLGIIEALNLQDMSVTQYHREIGGAAKPAIRHRFNVLEQTSWLRRVGKRPGQGRRGPREHLYRAVGPALSGGRIWSDVPESVKATESWMAFERISDGIKEAIRAGTFDARFDRHLTWSSLMLDQAGWQNATRLLAEQGAFLAEEEEAASARLAESGEEPVKMTVAMMAFESPKSSERAP